MVVGCIGSFMLFVGAALACRAGRYVGRTEQLERLAGILVVGGLSVIGIGLAWALNASVVVAP